MIWDFRQQSGNTEQYVIHYTLEYSARTYDVSIVKILDEYVSAIHLPNDEWLTAEKSFKSLDEALGHVERQIRQIPVPPE